MARFLHFVSIPMPAPESQLATNAGVFFVAYKVSLFGLVPALVRQGIRGIDLIVSNQDGSKNVPIHVRTSCNARRTESTATPSLQFPLTQRLVESVADSALFCFVDLQNKHPEKGPDVYVVPAASVKEEYAGVYFRKYAYVSHLRSLTFMDRFRDNWSPLLNSLAASEPDNENPTSFQNSWDPCEIEPARFVHA